MTVLQLKLIKVKNLILIILNGPLIHLIHPYIYQLGHSTILLLLGYYPSTFFNHYRYLESNFVWKIVPMKFTKLLIKIPFTIVCTF